MKGCATPFIKFRQYHRDDEPVFFSQPLAAATEMERENARWHDSCQKNKNVTHISLRQHVKQSLTKTKRDEEVISTAAK